MRISKTALLLGLAIVLVAFNLRTIAVAVGPVLPQIRADLTMSATLAGLLTALPTLCFALFGFIAARVGRRFGLHRSLLVAVTLNLAGQAGRNLANDSVSFLLATVVALAGIGVINVLLPPLVKRHFPARNGLMTALYITSQSIGLTLASLYTAPLAIALGSWREAFWVWAGTAALAVPLLVWSMTRFGDSEIRGSRHISIRDVARTRLGWVMAVFFGMQSAQAYGQFGWLPTIYQNAGFSAVEAGNFLAIVAGLGIPMSFIVPNLTARLERPVWLLLTMVACAVIGYSGLLYDPRVLPWLWPAFLAVAGAFFPMILVLLSVRTRSPAGTAALSSFTQAMGYVLASFGPFLFGLLKQVTGSWQWPLLIQLLITVPLAVCGLIAIGSTSLEDELGLPEAS